MKLLLGIDALLLTNPINVFYFIGFIGLSPEERESYVLITKNQLKF